MKNLFIMTVVFLFAVSVKAEIIYTDIVPDTVLKGSLDNMWAHYELDMNKDDTTEFIVTHFYPSNDLYYVEFSVSQYRDADILVDSNNKPLALSKGDTIGSNQIIWYDFKGYAIHCREHWAGATDKYLAVRLKTGGNYNYCWIRLDVAQDESSCTVKDFAYQATANTGIVAGDAGTTAVLENKNNNIEFKIYPNPVQEQLNISGLVQGSSVQIFDNTGILLFEHYTVNEDIQIDLKCFPAGMYFVKMGRNIQKFLIIR
ncbi:MAG: T9SS type A sorting domain-containing protein [Bacteroidota bacterium]